MGLNMADALVICGIIATVLAAIVKFTPILNQRYVTKELCGVLHAGLEKEFEHLRHDVGQMRAEFSGRLERIANILETRK